MLPNPLPDPDQYPDWKSWARACNAALNRQDLNTRQVARRAFYDVTHTPIPSDVLPSWPDGYTPLWYDEATAQLFLANPAYDPPVGADLVYIDTAAIADAAIETNKIDNLAVVTAKIANAGVDTTKIANLAVTNALIANLAVGSGKISDLAVGTAKIALAAIVTALIGDLQVVVGKISDLAVNEAKIANLAVTSGKIANLSIGAAHILDGAILNAKIGDTIQSTSWNPTTKAGWKIDKLGNISGQGLVIYDTSGNIIFGSGGGLWSALTGVPGNVSSLSGAEAILNSLFSMTSGGSWNNGGGGSGALNLANIAGLIDRVTQTTGFGTIAGQSTLSLGGSFLTGFGTLAAISLLSSGNISTYIAGAAIGSALIANLAVGTAHMNDLAVTTAKIADLAVISAKIADLVVSKITSGTLDAVIDVGAGILKFAIGSSSLYIGRGFGVSNQFFFWYGPSTVAPADATEGTATVYIKIDGSAYFLGATSGSGSGGFRADFSSDDESDTIEVDTGAVTVTGADRTYIINYSWGGNIYRVYPGSQTGSTSATIELERWNGASWDSLDSDGASGSHSVVDANNISESMGDSFSYLDTTGGVTVRLRARLSARSIVNFAGSPPDVDDSDTRVQTLAITILEI